MAEDNVVDKTFDVIGSVVGSVVGLAAGTVGAATKLAAGNDLDEAGKTFNKIGEKCCSEGGKIGKKYGLPVTLFVAGLFIPSLRNNGRNGT